jgi:hypothetical protein
MVKYTSEQQVILYGTYVKNYRVKEGFAVSTVVSKFQLQQ